MHSAIHDAIAAVWRIESATVTAAVARMVRDIGVAEELAQDALLSALEHWPTDGMPDRPGAWLMTTARRRALDHLRHQKMAHARHEGIAADLQAQQALTVPDFTDRLDELRADEIGDDLLRLVFTACHPVLPQPARVALTLRLLGGLSTHEIARGFLVPEPTIAQRIVRAKRTLAERNVPYEVPRGAALAERLESVLEVVYLIFNEGYTATTGDNWMRLDLCAEAVRLARLLAGLMPDEPEVLGLMALLELQASRSAARVDAQGDPILLDQQDRARWDPLLIRRGLDVLERADELLRARHARSARGERDRQSADAGPYHLQAAIAACHARATQAQDTDWPRIAALYALLAQLRPSPVVELNRAVAVSRADGPAAGLAIITGLLDHPALRNYQWLPSVQADLLQQLGRRAEARATWTRAASLAGNEREKRLLLQRAAALADD